MNFTDFCIAEEGVEEGVLTAVGLVGLVYFLNKISTNRQLKAAANNPEATNRYLRDALREISGGNKLSKKGYKIEFFRVDLGYRKIFSAYKPYCNKLTAEFIRLGNLYKADPDNYFDNPEYDKIESNIENICKAMSTALKEIRDNCREKEVITITEISKVNALLGDFTKYQKNASVWEAMYRAADKLNIDYNDGPFHDGGCLVNYITSEIDPDSIPLEGFFKVKISKI